MLKAHSPVTLILDPLLNSMFPLNVTLATHEESLISCDTSKLQLSQFSFTMDGAVVLIVSVSVLFNIRCPSEEKIRRKKTNLKTSTSSYRSFETFDIIQLILENGR